MTRLLLPTPEAQFDIDAAILSYEAARSGLGDRFLAELDNVFDRIREHPQQFPIIEHEVRRALLRRYPYAVYFLESERAVSVIA